MKRLLILLSTVCLLCACASQQISHNAIVASLNVGVQENNTTASRIAGMLFPQGEVAGLVDPHALEYQSIGVLQQGLSTGNYDIVIGLMEPLQKDPATGREHIALEQVRLNYFVLHERTDLGDLTDKTAFFSSVKSVGYLSTGQAGDINKTLVKSHPNAYIFAPCGSLQSCLDMLQKKQIDALASIGFSSIDVLRDALGSRTVPVISARIHERGTFGVLMNPLTMSREERHYLSDLFFQQGTLK